MTLSTCQLDFLLPRRFDLSYIDKDGSKQVPVVLHRAIFGTFDRFTAFLIEETKGAFPLWIAPTQVVVIPVSDEHHGEYAEEITSWLKEANYRVELDHRNEKLGYRLREAQTKKIPVTVILGEQEQKDQTISYRLFGEKDTTSCSKEEFLNYLQERIEKRR